MKDPLNVESNCECCGVPVIVGLDSVHKTIACIKCRGVIAKFIKAAIAKEKEGEVKAFSVYYGKVMCGQLNPNTRAKIAIFPREDDAKVFAEEMNLTRHGDYRVVPVTIRPDTKEDK